MAVQVVTIAKRAAGSLSTAPAVTLPVTPLPGDVVILVLETNLSTTLTGVSGLGATWTVDYQPDSTASLCHAVAMGVGATAAGVITATLSASRNGILYAYLIRGLGASPAVAGVTAGLNTGVSSLAGAAQSAGPGSIVIEMATTQPTTGTYTWPSAQTPPGAFTTEALDTGASRFYTGHAIPATTDSYSTSSTTSGNFIQRISQVVVGASSALDWFKADSLSLADGALVGGFPDTWPNSGSAAQAASAAGGARPTFKTLVSPTGLPVLRFGGSNFMEFATSRAAPSQTIIAVLKHGGGATYRTIIGSTVAGGAQFRLSNTNNLELVRQSQVLLGTSSATVSSTGFHVVAVTGSASAVAFYIDGVAAGTAAGGVLGTTGTGTIGSNTNNIPSELFVGDLAEVRTWDRVLTSTELATVTADLTAKWITPPVVPAMGFWGILQAAS